MNVKLQDDQTFWFRNLPPKESDELSYDALESVEKETELSYSLSR